MSLLIKPNPRTPWSLLLFPLALVLFEFSVYIGNDMILPGMPSIIREFGGDMKSIPTGMSTYMLGGILLQWLLGPLSDRIGRRPVLLFGVISFVIACSLIMFTTSLEQFFTLRVVQGMGLCFVTSVGYAAIQETFNETMAVKVTALMANVALIAPLIGPLVGAAIVTAASWHSTFVVVALLAAISFFGLHRFMPKDTKLVASPLSWRAVIADYRDVLKNRSFLLGTLATAAALLPILVWISQAPVILMVKANLSEIAYGLWQIPVFAGLILGNFIVTRLVHRVPVENLAHIGTPLIIIGLTFSLVAMLLSPEEYIYLVIGITICAIGSGISNAALTRLTLFSTSVGKGTASAIFSMLDMLFFTLGMEFVAFCYPWGGNLFFASALFICAIIFYFSATAFTGRTFIAAYKSLLTKEHSTTPI